MSPIQSLKSRLSLYGDFWTTFLLFLLRIFPPWFCILMTHPLALAFFCLARGQSAAIRGNLRALHPGWGEVRLWWAGYRVFVQFALTYMDRLWSLHLGHRLRWDCEGIEQLAEQLQKGGVLLFTAHSGNYDIGAAMFAENFPSKLHIVRMAERNAALHSFRREELTQAVRQSPQLQVHYCKDEWQLGLELCALLRSGEAVAVQGDRAASTDSTVRTARENVVFHLPRGPLILAQIARAPCCPIFLIRIGRCSYRISSGPPFYDGAPGRTIEEIGRGWLSVLHPFIKEHWEQWFVFESQLERVEPGRTRDTTERSMPPLMSRQCE